MRKALLLLCVLPLFVSAQKIIINGQQGYRQLTWDDFTGTPPVTSYMYTWGDTSAKLRYQIKWHYDSVCTVNKIPHFRYHISLTLDPHQTWVRKWLATPELLEHDQAHFDIGVLCTRELISRVQRETFTRTNYPFKLSKLYRQVFKKYHDWQKTYDAETNYGHNMEAQQRWLHFIREELTKYEDIPEGVIER